MRKILTTLSFGFLLFAAKAQTVSTFAGKQYIGIDQFNGTPNNLLLDEKFSQPRGIDIDSNGRIYVSDDHNILVLDGGTSRIRAGYLGDPNSGVGAADGTGTVSRFNYPAFLAVDKKSINVMIADQYNNGVRKMDRFTTTGNGQGVSTFAGKSGQSGDYSDGANLTAKFNLPCGIAISLDGATIYISDNYNDVIRKIKGGQVTTIAGIKGSPGFKDAIGTLAQFDNLFGLELKDDNTLLIADRNNFRIRSMNLTTGAVTTLVSGLSAPTDIAIVGNTYYIADGINIKKYVSGPSATVFAGSTTASGYKDGAASSAEFGDLYGITYSAKQDALYVTDMGNNVVRKIVLGIAPTANFTTSTTAATLGQTVILKNTSTNNPTSLSWSITPGTYTLLDGTTLTSDVVKVAFTATGGYTVALTATNGSGNNTKTQNNYITVSSFPLNKSDVDFTADYTSLKVGELASFTETSSNSPLTFAWTFTPNTVTFQNSTTASSRFPKVKFNQKGKYTVDLAVTNANGSSSKSKTDYIIVDWALAINKTKVLNEVIIYPNPSKGLFYIAGVDKGEYSFYNTSGQLISEGKVNAVTTVDTHELNSGVYILKINTIGGVISKRVVLQ